MSSALAFQIIRNVVIGGDVWYLRHYDGITFNSFTGDAVYLGPTFFWKIAPKVLVSASWEAQVAGHELGIASPFDLSDFSRQRARLLFEFEFSVPAPRQRPIRGGTMRAKLTVIRLMFGVFI